MEIFGVPVYLNLLSVVCILPVLLGVTGGLFTLTFRNKSTNTITFSFMLINLGMFMLGYAVATAVFDPLGRYHRWITVLTVLTVIANYFRFMMTYSELTHVTDVPKVFAGMMFFAVITWIFFASRSISNLGLFRANGQFWDYEMPLESLIVGGVIICYAFTTFFFIVRKFRAMTDRRNARTLLILCIILTAYHVPTAVLNPLSRKGLVSTDAFIWIIAIETVIAFFVAFVIFLSHTNERSTVAGNLVGVTLVAVLILVPLFGYPLIEDRKQSFRDIWAAKLQSLQKPAEDARVVFVTPPPHGLAPERKHPLHIVGRGERFSTEPSPEVEARRPPRSGEGRASSRGEGYFRDSQKYYENALAQIPSDGVILRADAKGGVYTFAVDFADSKRIVGLELIELRKFIHPTAAKLVLAQLIVILVIVALFPLFFRGILIRPMYRLLDGVIAVSRGRYGHRIENARSDELGVISRHFDKMAETIEAATTKLEDTVAQRTAQLSAEKKKSDQLLLNILPAQIAHELKEHGATKPMRIDSATVLFTDFAGFTQISESLTPEEVVAELDKCFSYFDQVTEKYRLEKLKTIGDSFMCAGGLPTPNRTHAIDCCLAGMEIQAFMNQMKEIKQQQGFPYWELRLGINTGPLVAGVVGHKKFAYDVWGDTVNTASRMESSGVTGAMNISHNTYELVKEFFVCTHRGKVKAKNKGEMDMYILERIKPEYARDSEGRVPNQKFLDAYKGIVRGRKS